MCQVARAGGAPCKRIEWKVGGRIHPSIIPVHGLTHSLTHSLTMTGIRVEKFSGHFVSAPVARVNVFFVVL